MRLTEERILVLARSVVDALLDDEHVDLEIDEDRFRTLVEGVILNDLRIEDEIDEEATAWVHQNKSFLEDGSPEFELELDKVKKDLAATRGYVIY